jgi:hypothetical protein
MSYYYLLTQVDNTAMYPRNLVATIGALVASITGPLILAGMAARALESKTRKAIPQKTLALAILVISFVPVVLFAYSFWLKNP